MGSGVRRGGRGGDTTDKEGGLTAAEGGGCGPTGGYRVRGEGGSEGRQGKVPLEDIEGRREERDRRWKGRRIAH